MCFEGSLHRQDFSVATFKKNPMRHRKMKFYYGRLGTIKSLLTIQAINS